MNRQATFVDTPSHTDTSIITAGDAALRYIAAMHGAEVPLEPFSAAVTAQALASALHPYKTPHGREADSKMVTAISTAQQQAEPAAYLKTAAGVMQLSFEGNPVVNVGADVEVQADTVQPLYAQPPAVAVPDGVARAVEAVAAAIYFADSSDYLSTLWDTLRFLSPEIAAIAESDTRAAWERAEQDRAMLAAAPQAAVAAPLPPYDVFSDDDGDSWEQHPASDNFVHGLQLGDEFELLAGWHAERVTFRVTKVPDDESDDYEVEEVTAPAAAQKGGA